MTSFLKTHYWLSLSLLLSNLSDSVLLGQPGFPALFEERDGLLIIETESISLGKMWVQATETQNHTSSTYIYWSGEHFFQNTGQGELVYPIYINTPGTYRFVWRMKVGKGIDVTNHNDNWLKVQGAQLYGQKPNGHRIAPQPGCTWMEGYDCPNGSSENGFFKVYGQDTSFIWQAQTSDNDGHELFVDFPRTGKYEIILHARSSHCWLDRLVFFHTQKISYAEATDIQQKATLPLKQPHTTVSIKDNQFYINGRLTYEGRYFHHHKIEGLLFNARLVQGIFDDLNPGSRDGFAYPDTQIWDPDRNTDEFVAAMSSWREHGLLAFTLNLQGGSPLGYGNKDWINSAFDPQGQLRPAYLNRLEKILNRADELGMVVILGYFYFGQDQQLQGEAAVINAVDNITNWILDKGYKNILVELNNECDIYYDHAILQAERIHELIDRVRKTEKGGFRLLVGTSYSGGHIPRSNVVQVSDYLLLHGNSVENPAQISDMIRRTRQLPEYNNQPILFNEDDHYDYDQPKNNLQAAIDGYASWGYFDFRREDDEFSAGFQTVPVDWRINSPRKIDFFEKIKEITGQ